MSDFKELVGPRNRIRNIEIDEVQAVENLCEAARGMPERQQLEVVEEFLQRNMLNALNPNAQISPEIRKRVWDQKTTKALSIVLEDRYGVCLDWHVVGQAILNKLGIETVFQVGKVADGPAHTYLDVKIEDKWEIFDPFARQYLADRGVSGKQFQSEYYLNSKAYKKEGTKS